MNRNKKATPGKCGKSRDALIISLCKCTKNTRNRQTISDLLMSITGLSLIGMFVLCLLQEGGMI